MWKLWTKINKIKEIHSTHRQRELPTEPVCSSEGQIVGNGSCVCVKFVRVYIFYRAIILDAVCVCAVCNGRKLMYSVAHINMGKKISHFSTAIWAGVTLIITGKIRVYIYLLLLYLFPIGTVIILPCSNFFSISILPGLSYGWLAGISIIR